jgi:hypothetical protein
MRGNRVLAAGVAALLAVVIGVAPAHASGSDTDAPIVTLDQPAALNPQTVSGVAGIAPGDGSGVTLEFFAGTTVSGPSSATVGAGKAADGAFTAGVPLLDDGTWTVRAIQGDTAGNTGTSPARTFTVDFHGPKVTITSPGPVTADAQPHFEGDAGTAPGDIADVLLTVTAATGGATTFPATTVRGGSFVADAPAPLADGVYTVVASQLDELGHAGTSQPLQFRVDTTAPTGPEPEVITAPIAGTDPPPAAAVITPPPGVVIVSQPLIKKAAAGLKITSAGATRRGRTITLKLRGTTAKTATGMIEVSAKGARKRAKITRGTWTVTLRLTGTTKSLKAAVAYGGDGRFAAATASRTVRPRS